LELKRTAVWTRRYHRTRHRFNMHSYKFTYPGSYGCGSQGLSFVHRKAFITHNGGVDELIEIVAQKKLISLVGCNMRFHPGLKKVKMLLEAEAIGRVIAARIEAGQYLLIGIHQRTIAKVTVLRVILEVE